MGGVRDLRTDILNRIFDVLRKAFSRVFLFGIGLEGGAAANEAATIWTILARQPLGCDRSITPMPGKSRSRGLE